MEIPDHSNRKERCRIMESSSLDAFLLFGSLVVAALWIGSLFAIWKLAQTRTDRPWLWVLVAFLLSFVLTPIISLAIWVILLVNYVRDRRGGGTTTGQGNAISLNLNAEPKHDDPS